MPANTPKGYPYPLGTDRLMDGDDSIHSLATAVDTNLGTGAAGTSVVTVATGGTPSALAVTFPAGRFTVAPAVVVSVNQNANTGVTATATGITTTGFALNAVRATSGTVQCQWIALQNP